MSKTQNRWAESSRAKISSASLTKNNRIYKLLSVLLALAAWQIASMSLDSQLLLPSPLAVINRLAEMICDGEVFSAVWFTLSRITLGFLGGVVCAFVLAVLSARFKVFEILLWPYMITVKSVPVASFVVIALVLINKIWLSALISFLIVLPIVYTNLLEGIKSVDNKMLEMATVFKMPFAKRLRFIWLPSVKSHFLASVKVSLGLAWKSGVAAELIGTPDGSVGDWLYYSKLYLLTTDLFAWTLAVVLLAMAFEKLFVFLLKKSLERAVKL